MTESTPLPLTAAAPEGAGVTPAPGRRRRRGPQRGTAGTLLGYLSMVLIAAVVLVPIAFIVLTSLKERPDIYTQPVQWIPDPFTAQNYATVLEDVPFVQYFWNSLLITGVLTVVQV
ncbi:MAG TPA: carbohydrate ABC transporter permease, partial [Citricoccus sp.]